MTIAQDLLLFYQSQNCEFVLLKVKRTDEKNEISKFGIALVKPSREKLRSFQKIIKT